MNIVLRSTGDLGNMLFEWACIRSYMSDVDTNIYWDPVNMDVCELERIGLPISKMPDSLRKWIPISSRSGIIHKVTYPLFSRLGLAYRVISDVYEQGRVVRSFNRSLFVQGRFQKCGLVTNAVRDEIRTVIHAQCPSFEPNVRGVVGVHIRRGDYTSEYWKGQIGLLSQAYFMDAIERLMLSGEPIKIFTDSPDDSMVQELARLWDAEISTNKNRYEDMIEMSCCSKLVISNSTFSLWAAMLGYDRLEAVLAPDPWVIREEELDLELPSEWELISSKWAD